MAESAGAGSQDATVRFSKRATAAGLEVDIVEHAQSTRTAEEAAAACGCHVSQIVKSLVFRGATSGTPYLLLVSGANQADEALMASAAGEKLVRPDARYVREVTGYAIGGIPPLGHDVTLRCFMDRMLLDHSEIWAAAGTPRAVFRVEPRTLAEKANASVVELARA